MLLFAMLIITFFQTCLYMKVPIIYLCTYETGKLHEFVASVFDSGGVITKKGSIHGRY